MKKIILFSFLALLVASCGVNQQIDQIKALENCKYQLVSADSIYLANTDISKFITPDGVNLKESPALALAFLQRNIPLMARLNLQITNPGKKTAGINQFEYIIMIKDQELTKGIINQQIKVEPKGGTTIVSIKINSNIYSLLASAQNRNALINFLSPNEEKKATVTFKIKPSLGNINYPGYISIDKEISNKLIFSSLEHL